MALRTALMLARARSSSLLPLASPIWMETDDSLVQILLHTLNLATHVPAVSGGGLLERVGNLGDTLETNLELTVVSDHSVGKSGQLGLEVTLGTGEGTGSGHLSLSQS